MIQLTPWYLCVDAQPSRVGWYQTKLHGAFGPGAGGPCRWWDGKNWRVGPLGDLTLFGNSLQRWPDDSWRGQVQP